MKNNGNQRISFSYETKKLSIMWKYFILSYSSVGDNFCARTMLGGRKRCTNFSYRKKGIKLRRQRKNFWKRNRFLLAHLKVKLKFCGIIVKTLVQEILILLSVSLFRNIFSRKKNIFCSFYQNKNDESLENYWNLIFMWKHNSAL